MMKPHDWRPTIIALCDKYTQPGEDWTSAALAGAPQVLTDDEALGVADWFTNDADIAWGHDPRHAAFGGELRSAITEAMTNN